MLVLAMYPGEHLEVDIKVGIAHIDWFQDKRSKDFHQEFVTQIINVSFYIINHFSLQLARYLVIVCKVQKVKITG